MNLLRYLKSFYQRGRYGWDYSDVFSADEYLSRIIPQMIRYLMTKNGYPTQLNSIEEWHDILEKIAYGFERYNNFQNIFIGNSTKEYENEYKKVRKDLDKSLKLLIKYFDSLWW